MANRNFQEENFVDSNKEIFGSDINDEDFTYRKSPQRALVADSTTASYETEREATGTSKKSEPTGATLFDLVNKIFSGEQLDVGKIIPYWPILWLILVGFLFSQDNQKFRLNSFEGWKWFGLKVILSFVIILIFLGFVWLTGKKEQDSSKK